MTQSQRTPLPSGLPKRFLDGQPGFHRLRKFLEIPNVKAVEALLDAVKDAVPRVPGKLRGAERRRVVLTAYYENPESRRELWRQALAPPPPAASRDQPLPSLESIALQRHDAEFRDREVDTATLEDALRVFPDVVESVADAPDWQRPVLAALPALHRDITEWTDLGEDRREAVMPAVFAAATVLDDLRLLQWAARGVDALADEFAPLLKDLPEESPGQEDDVIRRWREACDKIAATARLLAADSPQPELLPDLLRQVDGLSDLREPLVRVLERSSPEKLLQRVVDLLARLAESGDSPTAGLTDRIAAQWRSAYSPGTDLDIESLRTDVERLETELETALDAWRERCRHRKEIDERYRDAQRRAEQEDNALKRLDAQDREAELQEELGRAAGELLSARDHVFQVVGPGAQTFDPRRDYQEDPSSPPPESPDPDDESPAGPPDDTPAGTEDTAAAGTHDATEPTATTPGTDAGAATSVDDTPSPSVESPPDSAASGAQTPSAQDPPPDRLPVVDRRQTSVAEALWRTLRGGRPGIAYHIARLCAEQEHATLSPTLADIIAASMLAPHVHSPDSESVRDIRPILERIDPTALLRDERRQPQRDAVSLLLFSATLRPALFAPTTGATSLLRAVSLSDDLKPVYDLAVRVAEHADRLRGVRLHASMFRPSQTGTWQKQFDALTARVRAWQAGADSKRNIYGPATKVWRDLFGRDGLLAKLVRLISDSDKSFRLDVEAIHKQITDQRTFNQLVHRADQRGIKRIPIQGLALKQMWKDVQPAVDLSGQWLSLMDTRPDTAGFISQRIDALHNDLQLAGRRATEALQSALDTSPGAGPLAATLMHARKALDDLLRLLDRSAASTASSPGANVLRSRDLLYVTDVDIDTTFDPVSTDEIPLLDRLLTTTTHAETMRDAFHARLERADFIGARLALDFLEFEEGADVDEYIASLTDRIDDRRRTLRNDLQNTQKRLERAFCRGQLPADDRDTMAAALAALRQAAEPSSLTPPRLDDVKVLTGSSRRLLEIDDRIAASSRKSLEKVSSRLQHVPDYRMDETARAVVDRAIEQGYVQTAHEQLDRLERGESVEPPTPAEDPFSEFTSVVKAIEAARKTTDIPTIIRCAAARERVAAVPFDALSEEEAQSASSFLQAWYQTGRKRSVDTAQLRDFLEGLGFRVRTVTSQSTSQAAVTTEPLADRVVCPSRQFGSEAHGRYRVLLNWNTSAIDSVFGSIGIESGNPAIVLHFGRLGADRDAIRKRATREHRLFLVVDESLVLFLAGRGANPLSALFRCTLPYSAAEPYATTSGLVPAELFYGREAERRAIMDQSGRCFIYGGRQLGKTALLRRVEHDFRRTPDHVAKWIDLKVNDIDRPPDIWRVLKRELERERVIQMPSRFDPESKRQVDNLIDRIRRWLLDRTGRRLLLLLDEADHFLYVDAHNDFRESSRLKGLMDDTDRRFKAVFAGLHNVLRTVRQANHPLAHLGDPIRVGAMLSNGEWEQAQMLVRQPLQAVGCQFGRDDLSTRILAHTNYYPSLIQLFGAELMRGLRDSDKPFPYELSDDDIDRAHGSGDLGTAIAERFRLTLQLDPRYEVIAYALAYHLRENPAFGEGRQGAAILDMAHSWWPDGFALTATEFNMLLHEMEGLGVLRRVNSGYTLRNPNIFALLGSRQEIEDALLRPRDLPTPYAPASFRAPYPRDQPSSPRRGPLTREQESRLRHAGVAVLCGCPAAGLQDAGDFLSQRTQGELREFRRLEPLRSRAEFDDRLKRLEGVRNTVTVGLVPPSVEWDWSWIESARRFLDRKARVKTVQLRAAFLATPERLWRLLAEADTPKTDMVDWFELGPCDELFLRRWLEDIAVPGNARDLLEVSGGWPAVLELFAKKRAKTWQVRMDALVRDLEKRPEAQLRDRFGLSDEAAIVFRGFAIADEPFDEASVELVADEVGRDVDEVQRRVRWGQRLHLLQRTQDGRWKLNPMVKRLLEAYDPD